MSRKDLIFGTGVVESMPTTVVAGGGDNGADVVSGGIGTNHIVHV